MRYMMRMDLSHKRRKMSNLFSSSSTEHIRSCLINRAGNVFALKKRPFAFFLLFFHLPFVHMHKYMSIFRVWVPIRQLLTMADIQSSDQHQPNQPWPTTIVVVPI